MKPASGARGSMVRVITLAFAAILGTCWTLSSGATLAAEQDRAGAQTLAGTAWEIQHARGIEADAHKIDEFLSEAHGTLIAVFREHDPEARLKAVRLRVIIHAEPDERASTSTMTLQTSWNESRCDAELHLLAPSRHSAADRTNVGETKNDEYFHKTLVHEYASLLLEAITRAKPKGVRFQQSPNWFVQGYPEYLALLHSGQRSRTETLNKYRELLRAAPQRVDLSFGIDVSDPYVDGAMLLAFMHEEFGTAAVQAFLASHEPTFGRALRQALKVDLPGFASKWEAWVAKL